MSQMLKYCHIWRYDMVRFLMAIVYLHIWRYLLPYMAVFPDCVPTSDLKVKNTFIIAPLARILEVLFTDSINSILQYNKILIIRQAYSTFIHHSTTKSLRVPSQYQLSQGKPPHCKIVI